MYQGDNERARSLLREALQLMRQAGDRVFATYTLDALAGVASAERRPVRAIRLLAAAYSLADAIGLVLSPAQMVIMEPITRRVRAEADEATFAREWAEGHELTFEQAVTYALEETGPLG